MRLSRGASATLALGVSVLLAVTGCGGGSDDSGGSPEQTGEPAPSTTAPAAPDRIGGDGTGFSLALPGGWIELNVTADDLVADALAAGLPDELAETFPQFAAQVRDLGGFFAVDAPTTD